MIDATDRPLGRLATEAALALRGKTTPGFRPHMISEQEVAVINTDKVLVTGDKRNKKEYWRHSKYPGGITMTPFQKLFEEDSRQVVKKAIGGMLPRNRHRSILLSKNLKLYKGDKQ